eukprot:CAMPEP_0118673854 /NCGR_PEP_ID=MMETSP0800-20121206/563_1 /TAXON_ID=210618 ORGANISM="Striatella unipunctata, Strain CCMP2910" /NCGR_SAMPLE_ID=MMETSP0800 /ASSEMBLY_ACC=CAM_ASM_000638 /LENGTH=46 /DNA_ID= /DNA_START= /DNA_END= /DNA_ORIENTATION=
MIFIIQMKSTRFLSGAYIKQLEAIQGKGEEVEIFEDDFERDEDVSN